MMKMYFFNFLPEDGFLCVFAISKRLSIASVFLARILSSWQRKQTFLLSAIFCRTVFRSKNDSKSRKSKLTAITHILISA